jgi:integrase
MLTTPSGHKSYEEHCQKRGLKPSTINRRRAVLRAALNYAYKNGRLLFVPYVPTLQEGPPRPHFLTRPQAARLLWAARRLPHIALFHSNSLSARAVVATVRGDEHGDGRLAIGFDFVVVLCSCLIEACDNQEIGTFEKRGK